MKYFASINCNNLEDKVKLFEGQNDKIIKNKWTNQKWVTFIKDIESETKNSILKCQDKMTQWWILPNIL